MAALPVQVLDGAARGLISAQSNVVCISSELDLFFQCFHQCAKCKFLETLFKIILFQLSIFSRAFFSITFCATTVGRNLGYWRNAAI